MCDYVSVSFSCLYLRRSLANGLLNDALRLVNEPGCHVLVMVSEQGANIGGRLYISFIKWLVSNGLCCHKVKIYKFTKNKQGVSQCYHLHAWAPPTAAPGWVDERITRSRPKLNYGAGRDFRVGPEFGATRKQPIIPGNLEALVCQWRRSGHMTRSSAWLIPHIFLKHQTIISSVCFQHQIFSKLD